MGAFVPLEQNEPRGAIYGEPREDDLQYDPDVPGWRNNKGQHVCAAKTRQWKQTYRRCRRATAEGKRCYMHGGKTPKGKDHGMYKHGRYSQYMPSGLRKRHESVLHDEDLMELREDIAVAKMRQISILERVGVEDTADLWAELQQTYGELMDVDPSDIERHDELISELGRLIQRGASENQRWQEFMTLADQKRRLIDSERRREKELGEWLPIEKALVFIDAIDKIIRDHIDDHAVILNIGQDIERRILQ